MADTPRPMPYYSSSRRPPQRVRINHLDEAPAAPTAASPGRRSSPPRPPANRVRRLRKRRAKSRSQPQARERQRQSPSPPLPPPPTPPAEFHEFLNNVWCPPRPSSAASASSSAGASTSRAAPPNSQQQFNAHQAKLCSRIPTAPFGTSKQQQHRYYCGYHCHLDLSRGSVITGNYLIDLTKRSYCAASQNRAGPWAGGPDEGAGVERPPRPTSKRPTDVAEVGRQLRQPRQQPPLQVMVPVRYLPQQPKRKPRTLPIPPPSRRDVDDDEDDDDEQPIQLFARPPTPHRRPSMMRAPPMPSDSSSDSSSEGFIMERSRHTKSSHSTRQPRRGSQVKDLFGGVVDLTKIISKHKQQHDRKSDDDNERAE